MFGQRVTIGGVGVVLMAATLLACSDDGNTSGLPPGGPAGPGPGVGAGTSTGGSEGGAGGAGGSGGDAGGGSGGGAVVPDTPCASPAVAGVQLYDGANAPNVHALASVGGRWMANGEDGYVFFDRDGQNADALPTELLPDRSAIVSEGAAGGLVANNQNAIQFIRLDETGDSISGPAGVALLQPSVLSLAFRGGTTLVSWTNNTRIQARAVNDMGSFVGPAFDLVIGAYSSYAFLQSAGRGDEYAVVWSGDPMLGENKTSFVRADSTGALGDVITLLDTAASHSVAQVAATDDGYVVLIQGEVPMSRPLVMTLDAMGNPKSELMVLAGAQYAYGVASTGSGFAVLTGRESGEPQLRAFDLDGNPLAAWVCLSSDHDLIAPGAIAADGAGFATVHTTLDGSVWLNRVDALGTGAP